MSEPPADEPPARAAVPRDIPYRFERTHQTADIVGTWSALDPGEESGVTVGVAGRLMLLRNQGKAAFGELRDDVGRGAAVRPRRGDRALRRVREAESRGLDRRPRRSHPDAARRVVGARLRVGAAGRGAAQLWRQMARRQRRRDALPPARGRPVGQRALAPAAANAQRRRAPHAPALVGAGLRRGGDTVAAPHCGRSDGAPVRHAPQHVRHRLLPARGARALPQATGRRRLRQGVRDRPQLPQRGHLAAPQPRVHDARALPGLRRLQRHHGRLRGTGGRPGARRARDHEADLWRTRPRPHRRRGGAPP